jgi:hypothetical protein
VQHGDEDYAFQRKLEAAALQEPAEDVWHAELLPQLFEYQRRAEMLSTAGRDLIGLKGM